MSLCLAAALVLSLLPGLSGRADALTSELDVQVAGGPFVYNGSPHTPQLTVTRDGQPVPEEQCSVTYRNNIDAGTASVQVSCNGSSGEARFTIEPRELTARDFRFAGPCVKAYDRSTSAKPRLEVQALPTDDLTVSWGKAVYEDAYVGTNKTVTASNLSLGGADRGNYRIPSGLTLSDAVGQITPVELQVQRTATGFVGDTLDLMKTVSGAKAGRTYFNLDGNWLGCHVTLGGAFTAGNTPGTVTVLVDAEPVDENGDGTPEYVGGTERIQVTIRGEVSQPPVDEGPDEGSPEQPDQPIAPTQRLDQPNLVLSGKTTMTYGESIRFTTTGGAGSGQVTFRVINDLSGDATIDSSGRLTATKAGKVRVTAEKAGDSRYNPRTADALEVTISPAPITITVKSKSAVVGDPLPALSAADYTVSGLVGGDRLVKAPTLSYVTTPDMSRPGTIAIQAVGAQVPSSNYLPDIRYIRGTLTIAELPLYDITVVQPENGTITADKSSAEPGAKVTLQVQPAEGFLLESLTVTKAGGGTCRTTETGEGRYTFSMPEDHVTVTARFTEELLPVEIPFTDVKESDWFYGNVAYVYQNGLMNGTSDTAFSPNATTTRGMIVTILYRMEGSPQAPGWAPFSDVAPGAYYAKPVSWAAWNGIVNGKSASAFAPEDPITREQMAAILYRYSVYKGYDVSKTGDLSRFSDQSRIQAYAREAMAWANGEGLITGTGSSTLDPRGPATRAQVAAILQRFCESHTT